MQAPAGLHGEVLSFYEEIRRKGARLRDGIAEMQAFLGSYAENVTPPEDPEPPILDADGTLVNAEGRAVNIFSQLIDDHEFLVTNRGESIRDAYGHRVYARLRQRGMTAAEECAHNEQVRRHIDALKPSDPQLAAKRGRLQEQFTSSYGGTHAAPHDSEAGALKLRLNSIVNIFELINEKGDVVKAVRANLELAAILDAARYRFLVGKDRGEQVLDASGKPLADCNGRALHKRDRRLKEEKYAALIQSFGLTIGDDLTKHDKNGALIEDSLEDGLADSDFDESGSYTGASKKKREAQLTKKLSALLESAEPANSTPSGASTGSPGGQSLGAPFNLQDLLLRVEKSEERFPALLHTTGDSVSDTFCLLKDELSNPHIEAEPPNGAAGADANDPDSELFRALSPVKASATVEGGPEVPALSAPGALPPVQEHDNAVMCAIPSVRMYDHTIYNNDKLHNPAAGEDPACCSSQSSQDVRMLQRILNVADHQRQLKAETEPPPTQNVDIALPMPVKGSTAQSTMPCAVRSALFPAHSLHNTAAALSDSESERLRGNDHATEDKDGHNNTVADKQKRGCAFPYPQLRGRFLRTLSVPRILATPSDNSGKKGTGISVLHTLSPVQSKIPRQHQASDSIDGLSSSLCALSPVVHQKLRNMADLARDNSSLAIKGNTGSTEGEKETYRANEDGVFTRRPTHLTTDRCREPRQSRCTSDLGALLNPTSPSYTIHTHHGGPTDISTPGVILPESAPTPTLREGVTDNALIVADRGLSRAVERKPFVHIGSMTVPPGRGKDTGVSLTTPMSQGSPICSALIQAKHTSETRSPQAKDTPQESPSRVSPVVRRAEKAKAGGGFGTPLIGTVCPYAAEGPKTRQQEGTLGVASRISAQPSPPQNDNVVLLRTACVAPRHKDGDPV